MKYLLFAPIRTSAFVPHFISLVMDNAETYIKEGHSVDLLYCDGKAISVCFYNAYGDKKVCQSCNMLRKYMLSFLSKEIKRKPISAFYDESINYNTLQFSYNSIDDIKKLEYNQVKIGYAALSTYLTITRNLKPLINDDFRNYFDGLLIAACKLTDITDKASDYYQPDIVGVFNSRLICCRPVVDTCISKKIDFVSYEVGSDLQNNLVKKFFFNSTPHNTDYNTQIINKMWDSAMPSQEEKVRIAETFYYKRRNALAAADKVYVKDQVKGKMPDGWNNSKHNIVIFNSSEDEFAALGEEYEAMFFFPSQLVGIKYLINKYKDYPDYHFYVRIHPNLKEIEYSYHKELYDFGDCPNATIIPAHSDISTYALIDNADKVIVFGSTTGAEAAFADKPTILLGTSLYRFLDICYIPTNETELHEMILNKDLAPKDKIGTLKFAYYLMNDDFEKFKYFTSNKKKTYKFIKTFVLTDCMLKGSKISRYIGFLLQIYGKYVWDKSKRNIPELE